MGSNTSFQMIDEDGKVVLEVSAQDCADIVAMVVAEVFKRGVPAKKSAKKRIDR